MWAEEGRRNLLLITLDTVRADYMSCNGSDRVRTPSLDRLARRGANFTRTRAAVPLTLPSHASILTGTYPPTHGVRDNAGYRLPEEQVALAELLRENGYETAAFIGAFVLDSRFGLAQGFDVYDDRTWSDITMLENLKAERNAEAVFGAFSQWFQDYEGKKPFFVWIHYYDPHAPYEPPEPYRSQYRVDPYAGEVAYTDAYVGKIMELLEGRDFIENTVVAVVGDHGEGLGEHDEQTHSLLIYNSTLHVPMIVCAPGLVPEGRTIHALTRTIDLAPTLLDYLGFAARLGQGESLRPLIDKGEAEYTIASYSESLYPSIHLGWSALRGLETDRYRYILAPQPELYDLSTDTAEKINRIDSHPKIAQELQQQLEALAPAAPSSAAVPTIEPETAAMLRSLGYVTETGLEAGTVDPKEKMITWNQIQFAIHKFGQRDYAQALAALELALKSDDRIPMIYQYMGSCYMELKRYGDAKRVYLQAREKGIETVDQHVNLGIILHNEQESAEARGELQKAIALDEKSVPAHYRLANVYRAEKHFAKALEHYRKALDINPSYVYALNGLGMTFSRLGRDEDALDAFKKAVDVDPEGAPGYLNLAIQLERMGRNEEALTTYRKFMSISTDEQFPRERQRAANAIVRLSKQWW
jgi:arylsulfatase A-like enzyme/Tfp pilus assembly protein PilF